MFQNVNDDTRIYRFCTSVGICQNYDKSTGMYKIRVKKPQLNRNENEPNYHDYYIDEFQFMVWFVCHAEIISEEDMFKAAGVFWNESELSHKKPLLKCYKELLSMHLLYMSEQIISDVAQYEVGTLIQPYVVHYKEIKPFVSNFNTQLYVLRWSISKLFLSSGQKHILKYFLKNPGSTFFDYVKEAEIIKSGKYLELALNIKNLLNNGYISPVGWCTTTLPQSGI